MGSNRCVVECSYIQPVLARKDEEIARLREQLRVMTELRDSEADRCHRLNAALEAARDGEG